MSDRLRIVGATDGDPWSREMWSGSSQRLFGALRDAGVLAGAVSVRPKLLDAAEKAASWSPDGTRWRQRYRASSSPLSGAVRAAMSAVGSRRVAAVEPHPDALLQISGWYDAGRSAAPRVWATYQDANVALWLRRPDLALSPGDRLVARTMRAEQGVYDRMDLIMTMSEWARRSFVEDFGQDPRKVVTVGAGANLDSDPEPPVARDFGEPRLLFVGRKFERKGGNELLAAFAALRAERPGATLTIVGPPPGADGAGVRWLGPVFRDSQAGAARLDELFAQATMFVMPSLYEGFGMPFLEAMAYALPCVGTDTCAIPEIVVDGVSGRLAPPGDARALAAVLRELAADPEGCERMGRAGRERYLADFTWRAVAGRICAAIEASVGLSATRAGA